DLEGHGHAPRIPPIYAAAVPSQNAQQIEYWNGEGGRRWIAARANLDHGLAAIGDALLAFAAPSPGERVLDVGCGYGTTTWALAPGGRLAFVCWRALESNPWAAAPLVAAQSLLPPRPPVDPHAPGPFAFADGDRLRAILEAAGWHSIEIRAHDSTMWMGATLD